MPAYAGTVDAGRAGRLRSRAARPVIDWLKSSTGPAKVKVWKFLTANASPHGTMLL
jgi:hypothetical protein